MNTNSSPSLSSNSNNNNSSNKEEYTRDRTIHFSNEQPLPPPAKGILRRQREPARTKRIVWDEQNIAQTEREKSSTMKIDEPKTPYHYYDSSEEDDEEHAASRAQQLEDAVGQSFSRFHTDDSDSSGKESGDGGVEWTESDESGKENEGFGLGSFYNDVKTGVMFAPDSDDSGKDDKDPESRKKFAEKRKQHYNEYQMLRRMREKTKRTAIGEDDDVDDDQNDDKEKENRESNTTTTTTTTSETHTHSPSHSHTHSHSNHTHHKAKQSPDTSKPKLAGTNTSPNNHHNYKNTTSSNSKHNTTFSLDNNNDSSNDAEMADSD